MNKGLLIVISAPSGTGKSTVVKRLMEKMNDVVFSVSATTRAPRDGEVNGVDYYFITKAEFEKMIEKGEFLEYARYVDNYYGTPKTAVEEKLNNGLNVILDIEVQGGAQVRKLCPEALLVFLLPPSYEELEKRLILRGKDSIEVIKNRLEIAKAECLEAEKYDHVIVNDDLEKAVDELIKIIEEERK